MNRTISHPHLEEKTILAWADAHYIRHGKHPSTNSGIIPESDGLTWRAVDFSLRRGRRGLPAQGSVAKLLEREREKHLNHNRPELTVERILSLADSYNYLHGEFPTKASGWASVPLGETWAGIDTALRAGRRGLPGGSSLSRLLQQHRGKRNKQALPRYTTEQILSWADAYYARHGKYPRRASGKIPEAPGELWSTVESALSRGHRGLPGGSTLMQLLAAERGVRNIQRRPRLTPDNILSWADAHYRRHGAYPNVKSGQVDDEPSENWYRIHDSLRLGLRGLPGRSSLLKLLIASGRVSGRQQTKPASKAVGKTVVG